MIKNYFEKKPPFRKQILGKLTALTVDNHNISALEAGSFADGPISQKLERLIVSNGNVSDIPIEFLQVKKSFPFCFQTSNTKLSNEFNFLVTTKIENIGSPRKPCQRLKTKSIQKFT